MSIEKKRSFLSLLDQLRANGFHQSAWNLLQNIDCEDITLETDEWDNEISLTAFYTKNIKEGLLSCENLLHSFSFYSSTAFNNLVFYLASLSELIQDDTKAKFEMKLIIEEGQYTKEKNEFELVHFCNPSLCKINDRHSDVIISIRGINYHYNILGGIYEMKEYIKTETFLHYPPDNNLLYINCPLPDQIDTFPCDIKGVEDLRLFMYRKELFAIGTSREFSKDNHNRMILVNITRQKSVLLYGFNDHLTQKNWSPFIKDDSIHVIYSYTPLIVLKIDEQNGKVTQVWNNNQDVSFDFSSWRGSTQLIPLDSNPDSTHDTKDYLTVIHQVGTRYLDNGRIGRYYYHRFVCIRYNNNKKDWRIHSYSYPFYFKEKTIEFASGMVQVKKDLIITFGFEDRLPYMVTLPIESVEKILTKI